MSLTLHLSFYYVFHNWRSHNTMQTEPACIKGFQSKSINNYNNLP